MKLSRRTLLVGAVAAAIVVGVALLLAATRGCREREGFRPKPVAWWQWQRCTLSSYNVLTDDNTRSGDVAEFTGVGRSMVNVVNMAAVHSGDWPSWKYKWVEVKYKSYPVVRFQIWDLCADRDCESDDRNCCTNNREMNGNGFLLDLEANAVRRVWGIRNSEDNLLDSAMFRLVGSGSEYKATAKRFGLRG